MSSESKKVLIIEDEIDIAEDIALFLNHAGLKTVHEHDGADVINTVKREQPNLIIMDVMLPNKSGIQCSEEIRRFSNVPIIMVTALGEQRDKLSGLEIGADDYICKPFDADELVLRVKAVLRRTAESVNFSAWTINKSTLLVTFNDIRVSLSALEFSLFALLFTSPGRIYSRDQIIQYAYPDHRDISDRAIDSHVKNIRKKLRKQGIDQSPIQSIYGAGYTFRAS